jgi:lipid II isoglutaminyl synthase (glutamine-hydrolysing)
MGWQRTAGTGMKITVGYLYPDLMSAGADRGNVETIVRRCGWRNITAAVTKLRLDDKVVPGEIDLIMIGGGGESRQRLVAADLYKVKGAAIRDAVAGGAAALAVGGGYELFGRFCQPEKGVELRGIELFDAWTIRPAANPARDGGPSDARANRVFGDLVVRWGNRLLAGFEDHSGRTYLSPAARPLGRVVRGHGNDGMGSEGCVVGAAVGTNLRGPCLPANPALADFLISAALTHRYGTAELAPLTDELEAAAHDATVQRAQLAARGLGLARARR